MTHRITNLLADISERLGQIKILSKGNLAPHLRKENRIRTIHSSLAIEHNSLTVEQVSAILQGKRILGNPVEIKEVKNAYVAYEMLLTLDPYSVADLLKAHRVMMDGLIAENGRFRTGGVGVFNGRTPVHMAPPANMVPGQIQDLLAWYETSEIHPLIRSAVFHHEFEFIHPFADGNGRMGRLWHSLLLGRWNEIFFWLPVEELIRERQCEYYGSLGKSDMDADSCAFVEFLLQVIHDTLKRTTVVGNSDGQKSADPLIEKLARAIGKDVLSAAEIMQRLGLSHRPTFRQNYLNPALSLGVIEMTVPDKPTSRNQRYRLKK
ncbi:MAG: Fic family protein [Succinivibrionaceae bacterium]|nr:Fic family protein [Succinivibrionaceae bacterium]